MFPLRLVAFAFLLAPAMLPAAELSALPSGQVVQDVRLQALKDLDGYFPFTPPESAETWERRANNVRNQIAVALGLCPMPTRTPLNAVIHGRMDRGDYTVEKVYFESMPGFFVTGNLYRPAGPATEKRPGVLCPYGHWPDGRFFDASDEAIKKEFAMGAEKIVNAAHSPLQARCVQLARMGCVVFHYDMIGKADSVQIGNDIAHSFARQRPEMNNPEGWGFFSPQAEANGQSIMGLQTWNSIRSLDFLESLPDVDAKRLAVTGSSGGATQTMMLAALDERVQVAFPAVMVSTAMQGGCTCENACGLRVGTGNVEIASLFAPKPMAMSSADDWTKEMATKGLPEMKKLWATLGKPENVQLTEGLQFPHNYNAPARAAMYAWFNKHLGLNLPPERLEERDFPLLSREEMSVWDAAHPAPAGGPAFEKTLLRQWRDDVQGQLNVTAAQSDDTRKLFKTAEVIDDFRLGWARKLFKTAEVIDDFRLGWGVLLDRDPTATSNTSWSVKQKVDCGDYWRITGLIHSRDFETENPAVFLHPKNWNGAVVLWLDDAGKRGLFTPGETLKPVDGVAKLLKSGISVAGIDLPRQGEALPAGENAFTTRSVKNPREALAYTLGYNTPLFVQRVHDLFTFSLFARNDQHAPGKVGIVALDGTAPVAAAACYYLGSTINAAVIDDTFRFQNIITIRDPNLLPNAARFGDMPYLLSHSRTLLWQRAANTEAKASAEGLAWLQERMQKE